METRSGYVPWDMETNPIGLRGIEFTEFCATPSIDLERLFWDFGFSKTRRHATRDILCFEQNDIHFLLNAAKTGFAGAFASKHGPAICSMGWRVDDPAKAFVEATRRGAREAKSADLDHPYPAIYGIGDSLIYFIASASGPSIYERDFIPLEQPRRQPDKGFLRVDHLTNNVPAGEREKWTSFYKDVFGFTEVRYFDIKGAKTGLTSLALRSPDGSFCIPINQPKDERDQIAEYLRAYNGPGVQHLAFLTEDILASLDRLKGCSIETLNIDADYYQDVFKRVPNVREDHRRIEGHQVLVDGDEKGYLLQIFTKNIIGPIFIEIIQREKHLGFGEGNFGALFRSIEKDQEQRGVI
jgi:4-hydroxyphenylpyruvate dioxygenase